MICRKLILVFDYESNDYDKNEAIFIVIFEIDRCDRFSKYLRKTEVYRKLSIFNRYVKANKVINSH